MVSSWQGGYQLQLTVTNGSSTASTSWSAAFSFADTSETISQAWNATTTQSGEKVTAASASYNGAIPAGGSTTWGMTVNGSNPALSALSCTLS